MRPSPWRSRAPAGRSAGLAALAALALSCGDAEERSYVPWPEAGFALAWLVQAEAGLVSERGGPYVFRGGEIDPDPGPVFLPAKGQTYLVGFSEEGLGSLHPFLDPSRLEAAELRVEPELCRPGRVMDDGERTTASLEGQTIMHLSDAGFEDARQDRSELLAGLSAELLLGAEGCRIQGEEELEPFAASGDVFPVPPIIGGVQVDEGRYTSFKSVHRISDDRLLASAPGALYFLERGRAYEDRPEHRFLAETLPASGLPDETPSFLLTALDRRTDPPQRVVALLARASEGVASAVFLAELELGPGGAAVTGISEDLELLPAALLVDSEGLILLAGRQEGRAFVLTATSAGGTLSIHTELPVSRILGVADTGFAPAPHALAGAEGAAFVGRAGPDRFSFERSDAASMDLRSLTGRSGPDSAYLLAGGTQGEVFESVYDPRREWSWRSIPTYLPPEIPECAASVDACGRRPFLDEQVTGVALDPSPKRVRAYLHLNACPHVLAVEPSTGCTTALRTADEEPISVGDLEIAGQWLTVLGSGSRIYELHLAPDR